MVLIMIPIRIRASFLQIVLVVVLGGHSFELLAQENDFQVWTDVSLNKKLTNKWDLSFEQNVRFGNNVTQLSKSYSNLSAGYSVADYLKLSLLYRFVIRNKTDYYGLGHSFALDATLKQKFNRLKLSMRNRFMLKYSEILSSENGKVPDRYYRTKIELTYNIRNIPVDPSVTVESFLLLPKGDAATFDAIRTAFGLEYSINKHQALDAYWLNEWGLNKEAGINDYVLGLSYSYSF
jgi:hypothetical protein